MKKTVWAVLALLMSVLLFAACDPFARAYQSDGSLPSDVATTRGEDGAQESWLASLDTPSSELRRMYDEAVKDGSFTGSYFEFLKEIGMRDDSANIQRALRSCVTVECGFGTGSSRSYSLGSGVVYSLDTAAGDAFVVTNYHVVYNSESGGRETVPHISDEIKLYTYGAEVSSRAIPATYYGGAMDYDIAVLRVQNCALLRESAQNPVALTPVIAADSDSLTVGQPAYAIGNAKGEGMTVTEGVVSMDAEYIDVESADGSETLNLLAIRTDAAVNHGNSGGGLFNAAGECIGIVCARSEEEGDVGFGYAIHGNLAFSLVQNILDTCAKNPSVRGASVARLGVEVTAQDSRGLFDEATGKFYKEEKIVITSVTSGSAAQGAGIAVGDTVLSAKLTSTRGGKPYERTVDVTRMFKLTNLMFEVRLGDTLVLTISRLDTVQTIEISYQTSGFFLTVD